MEYLPPHSKEAEIAVLGSVLIDSQAIYEATEALETEDFLLKPHQEIFTAMCQLADEDRPVDLLLLRAQLEKNGTLEGVGGDAFLASLAQAVPTAANINEYIAIIKEKSTLRKLAGIGSSISKDAGLETKDAQAVLEEAEQSIYSVSQKKSASALTPIKEILEDTIESIELASVNKGTIQGISSGFTDLDRLTSGFMGNQLIVLAGRPGMGKTSLVLNFASHAAMRESKTVAIFSLEMTGVQLATRIICSEAMVDSQSATKGTLTDDEMAKVMESIGKLSTTRLYIDETSGIGIAGIRSKCRRLKKTAGLDMIIIDYLQLIQTPARSENRQQAISEMTRSLKNMAKELNVPILLLSQLSREPEKGTGSHRPMLSHLRESGSIEQDADIVMLIYRESEYVEESDDDTTDLIIAKNRNGPTATVKMTWMGNYTKYVAQNNFRTN